MKTGSLVLSVSSRRLSPCLMALLHSEWVSCSLQGAPLRILLPHLLITIKDWVPSLYIERILISITLRTKCLVTLTSNTGPTKFADFSNYTDPEHNPIDIPDNNPDFRRHHDFRQCKRYAEFRSIKQQPQSRSKQSFVPIRSYEPTGNWSRSCVKSF